MNICPEPVAQSPEVPRPVNWALRVEVTGRASVARSSGACAVQQEYGSAEVTGGRHCLPWTRTGNERRSNVEALEANPASGRSCSRSFPGLQLDPYRGPNRVAGKRLHVKNRSNESRVFSEIRRG